MFGTESGDRGEVHAHKDTTCFSLVWVLQRPPARTLQNAIIDSQQVEKKEGRKQTEILLKKDFDVEVGLAAFAPLRQRKVVRGGRGDTLSLGVVTPARRVVTYRPRDGKFTAVPR
ncbi:MAG: hypothetical protein PUK17_01395 [Bacteroidales bacterium]|nr:hypothetical protein [Bacteroidales bacterium]